MPNVEKLYLEKLISLQSQKQVDLFLFDGGFVLNKLDSVDAEIRKHPSALTTRFIETIAQLNQNKNATIVSEFAFKTQHLPIWVRLTNNVRSTSYEKLLSQLIPSALSVSTAGYSFIVPYTAGGFNWNSKPSEELYIRMMQAVTFMPSISIGKRPWDYSTKAVEITKKYLNLHLEQVPTLIKLAQERIQYGSPIVRPMWYAAPDDVRTFQIGDQCMLGDDIVVAPVVVVGQRERTVYLPAGEWTDQHAKVFIGPGQFKVAAPLEELPYFVRKTLVNKH